SVTVEAEVRIDTPVEITNRDVILIWDYQSDTSRTSRSLAPKPVSPRHNPAVRAGRVQLFGRSGVFCVPGVQGAHHADHSGGDVS
ncbi:hypothetical protein, partial [Streptomyces sp. NPDC002922]|uniref:hypothetical protein n=1 Tax=Streptomyces sp. NPDC002922 TaxID=3154439 RepID=UPI00339F14A0